MTFDTELVTQATTIRRQCDLLSGDALIVAVMREHGLTHPASHDADIDGVVDLTR